MRTLITICLIVAASFGFTQNREVKLVAKFTYEISAGMSNSGVLLNQSLFNLGFNFKNKNSYLYLLYVYNTNSIYRNFRPQLSLYKGHFLGLTFENHFLSNEKRFRPYFGLSFMSEVTSNHQEGFLSAAIDNETSFFPRDGHVHYPVFTGQSSSYMFNSSGFYYSTPLFGTASLGFDVRLIKDLHLSFSLGYGLQIMRYKYLEWKNDADYRELLKDIPKETRMLHYVNAELGLRYEFSFKKQ